MEHHRFVVTAILGALSLFAIGAARTLVAHGLWWKNGLEMLSVGGAAGTVSYLGRGVRQPVDGLLAVMRLSARWGKGHASRRVVRQIAQCLC